MPEDRSIFDRPSPDPDEVLTYGTDPDQCIDFYEADPTQPLVALIHGGYWSVRHDRIHLRPLADALKMHGFNVALVEYRREPGRPWVYIQDVLSAVRLVQEAAPVITVGHSAGGHLALLAAADVSTPVLALAPLADLSFALDRDLDDGAARQFIGAADPADFDPMLSRTLQAARLLHGTDDTLVPIDISRGYVASHDNATLREIDGIGHFEVIDPYHDVFDVVVEEIRDLSTT